MSQPGVLRIHQYLRTLQKVVETAITTANEVIKLDLYGMA
jgi:hypothetical protein